MDLTLTPEQEMLCRSARSFLSRTCTSEHVRAMEESELGFDRALWREMAALGWIGLAIPAEYGGGGLPFLELSLLLEEMGRVLLPSPLVPTAVLAAPLILALGSDEQRRRWLPEIAAGRVVATLALAEPGWSDEWAEVSTRLEGDRVEGTKALVPFVSGADLLVVVAAGSAVVLVERGAAGMESRRHATLDGASAFAVRFSDTPGDILGARVPIPEPARAEALERVKQCAAVATLAYATGAAERVLEMTLEHARTRQQFGRPIGSFQAVAHRCVDMRADLDALRYLVYQAAWMLGSRAPGADLATSTAKAFGNDALRRLHQHAHQVHGAIGFSMEYDLQLFTRRAKSIELTWGSATLHRERVARAMGL